MFGLLSTLLAAAVVLMVFLIALLGWGGRIRTLERVGLCMMAAGLLWAGPARFLGQPAGLGDLMFLAGLLTLLWAIYGRAVWNRADALDGQADGRVNVVMLHQGEAVTRSSFAKAARPVARGKPPRR